MVKANIIIVDDNLYFSKNLSSYLEYSNLNIHIIATLSNGKELLEELENTKIELLILDLNMPKLNGLEVLEKIMNLEKINFKVLIISGERSLVNKIDVKFYSIIYKILLKPVALKDIKSTIEEIILQKDNQYSLNEVIESILSNFNFNRISRGYDYIKSCLRNSMENVYLLQNIENLLYPQVAREFNESSFHIKWTIQKCINTMIQNTSIKVIETFFPYNSKITNKVFIKIIRQYIVNSMKGE